MGVDHRGHGVGGVVETVDELEAQGNQQRQAEQQKWGPGGDHGAGGVDVAKQAPGGVQQPAHQQAEKQGQGGAAGFVVETGAGVKVGQRWAASQGRGGHDDGSGLPGRVEPCPAMIKTIADFIVTSVKESPRIKGPADGAKR
ncbi:hypothetical protein D3C80_1329140 [compost metagenome]